MLLQFLFVAASSHAERVCGHFSTIFAVSVEAMHPVEDTIKGNWKKNA